MKTNTQPLGTIEDINLLAYDNIKISKDSDKYITLTCKIGVNTEYYVLDKNTKVVIGYQK